MPRTYEVNGCTIFRGKDVQLGGAVWDGSKRWYVRSLRTGRVLTYEKTLRDAKAYAAEYIHPQGGYPMTDIRIENHGSIVLLRPLTPRGFDWMAENVGTESQMWGHAWVAEPRYVADVVTGMQNDGLEVEA